jgi:hypothetical protein
MSFWSVPRADHEELDAIAGNAVQFSMIDGLAS